MRKKQTPIAQSAEVVEYTDCRGVRPLPNECPEYDTKQSDGEVPVMLELWGMRSTFYCHRSQVHSDPEL